MNSHYFFYCYYYFFYKIGSLEKFLAEKPEKTQRQRMLFIAFWTTAKLLSAPGFSKHTTGAHSVLWLPTCSDKTGLSYYVHGHVLLTARTRSCLTVARPGPIVTLSVFFPGETSTCLYWRSVFCKFFLGFGEWVSVLASHGNLQKQECVARDVLKPELLFCQPCDRGAGIDAVSVFQLVCRPPGKQVFVLLPCC